MPVVYLARLKGTTSVYVGCTSKSLPQRREEHVANALNGSPWKFHRALRERGPSSFEWSVLATVASMSEAFRIERQQIARYNSFKFGFNSTLGGQGSSSDGRKKKVKLPMRQRRR